MMERTCDDDLELFKESMRGVAPLGKRSRSEHATTPARQSAKPEVSMAEQDPAFTLPHIQPIQGQAVLDWRRPGLLDKQYQNLRKGRLKPVPREFDLHGLKPEQAAKEIYRVIEDTQREQRVALCLIHGKGMRSHSEGSLIKGVTVHILQQHSEVLGFHSVPGNTGAVNVLIRKSRS